MKQLLFPLRPALFCRMAYLSTLVILFSLTSCGGGGGGDGTPLQTNACGTLGLGTRIINGATCTEGGSPVVEIVLLSRGGAVSLCSGSLLTNRHVLTAAHCFFDDIVQAFVEVNDKRIFGSVVTVHPGAAPSKGVAAVFNDVAIITLAEALSGQSTLPVIVSQQIQSGNIFSIYGYGIDENDTLGELQSGQMRARDVTENHIIAFYDGEGSNSCNGDSGGPAIFTTDGGVTGIVGVVSSGTNTECTEGDNSVYANVQGTSILNFITQVVPNVRLE